MFRVPVLLVALAAAVPGVARAADPLPPHLALVPHDAAVFAHADLTAIYKSPLGDTFRGVKIPAIEAFLKQFTDVTGLTADDMGSATLIIPKLTGNEQPAIAVIVRTAKDYNREKMVAFMRKEFGDKLALVPGHKYTIDKAAAIDLSDLKTVRAYFNFGDKELLPQPADAAGPITAAIKAAAAGKPLAVGVSFASLPDEIRGDALPPEFAPYKPLFLSESGIGVGEMTGSELKLNIAFKSSTPAKAVEAEKSIGAMKTLLTTLMAFGVSKLKESKDPIEQRTLPLLIAMQDAVKKAKIATDDSTAGVALAIKTDTDYKPLLENVFGQMGQSAARAKDQNNLKQLALAMHNYHDANGSLPPAAIVGKKGKALLSWRVALLPYAEQDALCKKFKLDEAWDSPHNKKVFDDNPMPAVFGLPGVTKPDEKNTHYQVFLGNGAMFDLVQPTKFTTVTDGLSNTLMIATAKKAVPWTKPDDLEFDPKANPADLLLFKDGGSNMAFGDGSVRSLRDKTKADMWRGLVTKGGGEVITYND